MKKDNQMAPKSRIINVPKRQLHVILKNKGPGRCFFTVVINATAARNPHK